jgi:hypothetical protein
VVQSLWWLISSYLLIKKGVINVEPVMVDQNVGLADVEGYVVSEANELEFSKQELESLFRLCDQLNRELKDLFEIESDRKAQILNELKDIPEKLKKLQWRVTMETLGITNWIPLDPLSWRNHETKLPVFALFSFASSEAGFRKYWRKAAPWETNHVSGEYVTGKAKYFPEVPFHLEWNLPYKDLDELFAQHPYRPVADDPNWKNDDITVEISTHFSGTIPSEIRAKVRQIMELKVFDQMFLLCEAQEWKTHSIPQPAGKVKVDPLVVGYVRSYPDRLWYIDAFDITPLENTIPVAG